MRSQSTSSTKARGELESNVKSLDAIMFRYSHPITLSLFALRQEGN